MVKLHWIKIGCNRRRFLRDSAMLTVAGINPFSVQNAYAGGSKKHSVRPCLPIL